MSRVESDKNIEMENDEIGNKILIVDDQVFNINALLIILQYSMKIDIRKVSKATSG